ncbi:MAG: radical SAM protein [Candidatus Gygaella obscura]|nr:radical SAM protein [Candidatus Gygaella obscura]
MEKEKRIKFVWNLHYACNYRCSYCNFNGSWDELSVKNKKISKNDWIKAWDRIYDLYGSVDIHLVGGEPCIYPDFTEIVCRISKKHFLGLTTNLSVDFKRFADSVSPKRFEFGIGASFHPQYVKFEDFLSKVIELKNKGFKIWVNYVAYPPQIDKMNFFKSTLQKHGIPFVVQPFRGTYNDKIYPEAYTDSDRSIIKDIAGTDSSIQQDMQYQLDRKNTKGVLCRAGQILAHIEPDGTVKRCGLIEKPIGNIFDANFRLLDKPLPCTEEHCPCDYIYLVDSNEKLNEYSAKRQDNISEKEASAHVVVDLIEEAEFCLFKLEDFDTAEALIKKALAKDKDNIWGLRVLANIFRRKAESNNNDNLLLQKAREVIDDALFISKGDSCVLAESARIYLAQNQYRKADFEIVKAIKKDSENTYFQEVNQKIKDTALSSIDKNSLSVSNDHLDMMLVLTPGWGRESAPFALASLTGLLRKHNFIVKSFDINNFIFHRLSSDKSSVQLWDWEQCGFWDDRPSVENFINKNSILIDSIVDSILKQKPEVIGFSVYLTTKIMSLEFARRIKAKNPNILIVFGGSQCRRKENWRELIENDFVDAIILDDAEATIIDFLNIFKKEKKIKYCPGLIYRDGTDIIDCGDRSVVDLDDLPFADFSDFDFKSYKCPHIIKIAFSRGCTEGCAYCSARTVWRGFRTMNGERIFNEIKFQVENFHKRMDYSMIPHLIFLDSLINANMLVLKDWLMRLVEVRKDKNGPLFNFIWRAQAIIRPEMNEEIISLIKDSGCVEINYGIESGSAKVLKDMRKRYTPEIAEKVVRCIYKYGIPAKANFMFGFPTETEEDFKGTLNFIQRNARFMTEVYPSRTFCAIERFTYLFENREKFGILPQKQENHLFWQSQNGKNNYLVRVERYFAFCKLLANLDHKPLVTGVDNIERDKWLSLGQYYQYEQDFTKALECYDNYIKLNGVIDSVEESMNICKAYLSKRETKI